MLLFILLVFVFMEYLMKKILEEKKDIIEAVRILSKELKEDVDFYTNWQIHMSNSFREQVFKLGFDRNMVYHLTDEQLTQVANQAAKNFLDLLIEE